MININKNNNDLILKAKNNDSEAIEKILKDFEGYIYKKYSKYKIKNYELEDLIQECNIDIIKAIRKYDISKNSFATYITRTINNRFNLIYEKAIPHFKHENYLDCIENINEKENPNENISDMLNEVSFYEIVKDLKENQKQVLIYFYLYNYRVKDIAKIMNIPIKKCMNIKKNAMRNLKNKFLN